MLRLTSITIVNQFKNTPISPSAMIGRNPNRIIKNRVIRGNQKQSTVKGGKKNTVRIIAGRYDHINANANIQIFFIND